MQIVNVQISKNFVKEKIEMEKGLQLDVVDYYEGSAMVADADQSRHTTHTCRPHAAKKAFASFKSMPRLILKRNIFQCPSL